LAILCALQLLGSAQNDQTPFLNGFPTVRGDDTLHVVESYYDPTTCKVSLPNMGLWPRSAAPEAMVVFRTSPPDSFGIHAKFDFSKNEFEKTTKIEPFF
jgi:hypothetical protein